MSVRIVHPMDSTPSPQSATLFQATGTALTTAYATVGTADVALENVTSLFLRVIYTAGDETSIEVRARYRVRAGGNLTQPTVITSSGATSVIALLEYRFSGTGNYSIPFGLEGRFVTFEIKATGGTPSGSFGAELFLIRE